MSQCKKCSNSFLKEDAIFCPSCGCLTGSKIPKSILPDKANGAVAFLTFLLSVFFAKGMFFGFTLWAAKTDITPKAARTYGLCAVIPWIIRWVLPTLIAICTAVILLVVGGVFVGLHFADVLTIPFLPF